MIKPSRSKTKTSEATKALKAKIAELTGKKTRAPKENTDPFAYRPGMGSDFYQTHEWRELRWQVLRESDGKCAMCGSRKTPLHCDHKKPRSKFPHLELVKANLQVLCEDCNLGKGASL